LCRTAIVISTGFKISIWYKHGTSDGSAALNSSFRRPFRIVPNLSDRFRRYVDFGGRGLFVLNRCVQEYQLRQLIQNHFSRRHLAHKSDWQSIQVQSGQHIGLLQFEADSIVFLLFLQRH
jgi:hypothetical protein